MEIKKFKYNGKEREVIVFEETDTHIKGADISYLDKEELKENWRTVTKDLDYSQMTEEQRKSEYEKTKELMKNYRNFAKNKME